MQRLHEDDLAGHLLRQGGWDHLELPAIALDEQIVELGNGKTHLRHVGDILHPEREGLAALDAIKRDVGSLMFSAQYQQRPVPVEGNLIRRAWFRYYDPAALPSSSYATRIVQSWDIAMQTNEKNDYSVCTTWRVEKNDVYLLDLFRGRLEYPDLRRKLIALAHLHRPATILIEDAGPGMSLLQDLRNSMPAGLIRPIGVRPVGEKVDRMAAQSAKFEAGEVHLAKDAPWNAEFPSEMLAFPNGRHDDQVDSVSQLLTWRQTVWSQMQVPIVVPFVCSRRRQFPW